jgi:hypothetical protein
VCAAPARVHQLAVSLSVGHGAERKPLCPGESLRTHDPLVVAVESASEAYLRLVFVSADGQVSEWLSSPPQDITRKASFRSPEGALSNIAGEGQLFLVASLQPLAETDPIMQGMLDVIRETAAPPSERGFTRSAEVLQIETLAGLEADFDENGVVMLAIDLHAAR